MCSTEQSKLCQQKLLSLASISKHEFLNDYGACDETTKRELFVLILNEIEKTILENNIDRLKELSCLIDNITKQNIPITLNDSHEQSVTLFEANHRVFYYAIRSNNIDLLGKLFDKWAENYFALHPRKLDEILSVAYEELKLKNIPLTEETEMFVQSKLINLRFFCSISGETPRSKSDPSGIRKRIELVIESIHLLKVEYSNDKEEDEKFIFVATFITKNLHILKRLLKSTYDTLPWEEIEFCLTSFISSLIKKKEINLYYNFVLDKIKILNHLNHFGETLSREKNNFDLNANKIAVLPNLTREKIVAKIINSGEFLELYNDYKLIRDVHCLQQINENIKLAVASDPKKREGQLIIIRVLQIMGENLKNTLESPNLSCTTSELLLLSLPKNTRKIIKDLRNSLSHAYSLTKLIEIEENKQIHFFIGIQNDINKIDAVITDIFYNKKITIIKTLLERLINTDSISEIKKIAKIFNVGGFQKLILTKGNISKEVKLKQLINEFSQLITDKSNYENELFIEIKDLIHSKKTESDNITEYTVGTELLKCLSRQFNEDLINGPNEIRILKFLAKNTSKMFPEIGSIDLKKISHLWIRIAQSVQSRMMIENKQLSSIVFDKLHNTSVEEKLEKLNLLTYKLFDLTEFVTTDVKWIENLREMLSGKSSRTALNKPTGVYNTRKEQYDKQLAMKLAELTSIINNCAPNNTLPCYRKKKDLQAIIEMLLLTILSILGRSEKHVESNVLFLDDNAPLLIGKCLRNHLAHNNTLINILPYDYLTTVLLNAKKFMSEDVKKCKNQIGKLIRDDPCKLKYKYEQSLSIITSQERMFVALEEGDLEKLKDCLQIGADIKARNINLWTSLHFAAKRPNLNIVKFIVDQKLNINAKDVDGQIPLHVAAAFGRTNIVEYFLKETDVNVEDDLGKTPLILASRNGHKNTVEILLLNNADSNLQDLAGYTPLTYAVNNNHIDVVKTLLKKENNINTYQTSGGFTLLHIAAEKGHRELVNIFLESGANVNQKNDKGGIPLHTAALNGHFEIVNSLLLKGANVNCRNVDGCTSLHYAIENGHQSIANALLQHGADVNAADKLYNNTPIHYAAHDGLEEIVKTLLKYNAHANIRTANGLTPLHVAAMKGHLTIVDTLLKYGVKICSEDGNKATPLHYAAVNGHGKVVELLINKGAAVNLVDCNARTPLHLAALEGHKDVTEILVKHKARVGCQDIEGMAPLHLAALSGSNDIINILLCNRAEVNVVSNFRVTPLYIAASNGHVDMVTLLINSKADVNAKNDNDCTPLHDAVKKGHYGVIIILLKNKAKVNAIAFGNATPLHMAILTGRTKIAEVLIANGANVNINTQNQTPLFLAVQFNNKEIVKVLIENGANLNRDGTYCLSAASYAGYRDIVDILLRHKISINSKILNCTPLHLAAHKGDKHLVNLLLKRGADVNAVGHFNFTPLLFAARGGHEEVVGILMTQGAQINVQSEEGSTPLHYAAVNGFDNVVKVLLINKAKVGIKDYNNRLPLEQAVACGHFGVVKLLVEYKQINMNAKGNDDFTILHIAAQEGHLDITDYLINKGCDINARNVKGTKPIHIAAREGHKHIVEFFLDKGVSANDTGTAYQTVLHYACLTGQLEIVKVLIEKNADINFKDVVGRTPIHIAARFGFSDIINILLRKGAVYNVDNNICPTPLKMATDEQVINLLSSTDKLFKAVRCNNSTDVVNHIKAGAGVNAKNTKSVTSLHYAAWKGYDDIVDILLKNDANPNIVNNTGFSPLHFAVKFSHIKIIKALISKGAVYNATSNDGKTPLDLAVDTPIKYLLNLIEESFKDIKNGDPKIINVLNKTDKDTIKTIMRAHNKQNQTLVTVAVLNDFSKVEPLKEISQEGVSAQIVNAQTLFNQGDYRNALSTFKSIFEKRKEIYGANNPATLDIQKDIAKSLYKQGVYQEVLNILEKVFQTQRDLLGSKNKDTLNTRSLLALVMHGQKKDEEAFSIFQDVYQKQLEILGPSHPDTLETEFNMALVMNNLKKYEEALSIYRTHFEQSKRQLGAMHGATVGAEHNIAMVLANQGKYEEALNMYKKVYEKRKIILGVNHLDTLRTWHNIAGIYLRQKKFSEALKEYEEILTIQKNTLGNNHSGTLDTQYNLANVLFIQGKWNYALKIYKETVEQMKLMYGPSYPCVHDILAKIKAINLKLKFEGGATTEDLKQWQNDMSIAASTGDLEAVKRLLKDGIDVNYADVDAITPLHYAVSKGCTHVVNTLLQNGARVTAITNKGNTPLHIAISKDYREIVEILLQHVPPNNVCDFVNAKTTTNGTTALHVASKNGSINAVMTLLKHDAIYDVKNKEGKTALDISNDQRVTDLLELTEKLFKDTKIGSAINVVNQLKFVNDDEFLCLMKARNSSGNTLIEVAIANKHKNISDELLMRKATVLTIHNKDMA